MQFIRPTKSARKHCADLRDLTVSRLTLFNARRGGEPARLTLKEWNEAASGTWLGTDIDGKANEIERKLFGDFKLTYQSGKGNNHLFPLDIVPANGKT